MESGLESKDLPGPTEGTGLQEGTQELPGTRPGERISLRARELSGQQLTQGGSLVFSPAGLA